MQTLFVITSDYQVHENYNVDNPSFNPYWKPKGGYEVVCSGILNLEQIQALSLDEKQAMVDASRPESDDYTRYTNQNWSIETLNESLIDEVRAAISEYPNDVDFARYLFPSSEFAFNWAVKEGNLLPETAAA